MKKKKVYIIQLPNGSIMKSLVVNRTMINSVNIQLEYRNYYYFYYFNNIIGYGLRISNDLLAVNMNKP